MAEPRRRYFATHRQLTGAAYIHHAYVEDRMAGKVVMSCAHRHGARDYNGGILAMVCAEQMLAKWLKSIPVEQHTYTPTSVKTVQDDSQAAVRVLEEKTVNIALPADYDGKSMPEVVVRDIVDAALFKSGPIVVLNHVLGAFNEFRDQRDYASAIKLAGLIMRFAAENRSSFVCQACGEYWELHGRSCVGSSINTKEEG